MWLDVHYKDQGFDVMIEDTDRTSLMDLFEYMFEDSERQNVILPKYFSLYVMPSRTNRKLELTGDTQMLQMWDWYEGRETIQVFLEEKSGPSVVFKDAVASWENRLKAKAEKERIELEKAKRVVEEQEAERELME